MYIYDLFNKIDNSIEFADDIIVLHSDGKIEKINQELQNKFNIAENYAIDWHMKNSNKCPIKTLLNT